MLRSFGSGLNWKFYRRYYQRKSFNWHLKLDFYNEKISIDFPKNKSYEMIGKWLEPDWFFLGSEKTVFKAISSVLLIIVSRENVKR